MKKILVPTDFSEASINALHVALPIAKITHSEIMLKHILDVPLVYNTSNNSYFVDKDALDKKLENAKGKLASIKSNFDYDKIITSVIVRPADSIPETIVERGGDLIVMGTTGASGLKEILVGSNSEKVVRYAKQPVITVNGKVEFFFPRNAAVPVDIFLEKKIVREKVEEFLDMTGATGHYFYINTPNRFKSSLEIEAALEKFKERNSITSMIFEVVNAYTEEDGIIDFAKSKKMDLIIMQSEGLTGLKHFLAGSTAEDVVNKSPIPVMTFKI